MSTTSRDLRWLSYFQNVAVAARAVFLAVGGVQVSVDSGGVVVEVVEVVEVVAIVVAVADLGVVMVAVVPTEAAVVHNLLFNQKNSLELVRYTGHGLLVVSQKFRVSVPLPQQIPI